MLQDFESFINKVLACLGLVLSGGDRNYLLTNSQIIRTTFDNCSSCYFRLQTRILLTVPLVIYFLLDTISQGFSYCSYYYYLMLETNLPGFAYCSTCYLFMLESNPRVLLTVPLVIYFMLETPSPRFFSLFHLLFILR
jgi:hypothetical protein